MNGPPGFVVVAVVPAGIVAGGRFGQVDDGLAGLRAQLEDGAELGAADPGVAHQGQQLDLLPQQPKRPVRMTRGGRS